MQVKFCGIYLGNADAWEDIDTGIIAFYNFIPTADYINIFGETPAILIVDWNEGTITHSIDDDTNREFTIIPTIKEEFEGE